MIDINTGLTIDEESTKHPLYCYYNKAAGFYTSPFDAGALPPQAFVQGVIRSIQMDPAGMKKQHFDEMDLYQVGWFKDQSGTIELIDKKLLCNFSGYFPKEA